MSSEPSQVSSLSRRRIVVAAPAAAALMAADRLRSAQATGAAATEPSAGEGPAATKGRIRHSVCLWCYRMPAAEMAPVARKLGLKGIDLLAPDDFPVLKEHGLLCTMTSGVWGGIPKGLNRVEHHEPILKSLRELIDASAKFGFPNVICFSGNRGGLSDEDGLKNCADGLKQIAGYAEEKKVTVCMELLNSKVDHRDYQCDRSPWGVELCKRVGSERFKLLYDIYHMQIMEGDVIRTIQDNHRYFAHYHTGGNPGRNEIDETQELHYPAIMRAIVATGFQGYVAQEFIPKRPDKLASLAEAVRICDV
jgi:hydroxypyruvate isomerase